MDLTARLWPDCVGNRLSIRKKAKFGVLWLISRSFLADSGLNGARERPKLPIPA
ncbi:hypothetical protein H8A99_30835 [Bradyrhizobium sp. Arg68]|uniref:hypothetical protein n=1 Tax=Bradyrhizobium ivorense TaxID=2511166 RepID=UPI001E5A2280|nr:hypothetical protein [Bradyrhizobium ivorense]MCC8940718.1 hypothetical protein [Bradyrhizobium ivorense]